MAERRILNSWKEIAGYLGRGVRTVQRWEAQLGLPVHRPAGKDHSAVIAFSSELDQWLNLRPLRDSASDETQSAFDSAAAQALLGKTEVLLEKCETLLLRNDELCRKISQVAEALNDEANRREARKPSSSRRVEAGLA
jgi:hypothetical protein